MLNSMLLGTESRIALQTVQALIKGEKQGRVRDLFFIHIGLGIVRKEWLSISTFGQRVKDSGPREVVCVDAILQPEAYVEPEISHISNERIEVVKNDFPHFHDLWFSDVCKTKEQLQIDLLIGANFRRGQLHGGRPNNPYPLKLSLGGCCRAP